MYKKYLMLLVSLIILALCAGCGDPVKSDLEAYLNFEMGIQKEAEDLSLDVAGNLKSVGHSKDEALKAFKDATQRLTEYADKQKGYQPKTQEVQNIHGKMTKMLDDTLEVFQQLTILVENDPKQPTKEDLDKLNQKQQEIITLTKEYRNDLYKLAEQKKVEVKLKF